MANISNLSSSKQVSQSNTAHKIDPDAALAKISSEREEGPTLDDLLRMPLEESGQYLRRAADKAAEEYLNDPSVTEFTCLDSEDFVDDPEEG